MHLLIEFRFCSKMLLMLTSYVRAKLCEAYHMTCDLKAPACAITVTDKSDFAAAVAVCLVRASALNNLGRPTKRPQSRPKTMNGMLEYQTQGFNGYAVKYSPFFDSRIAVASSGMFCLVLRGIALAY
jgi:hypothetical protein